jgi:tRNA threonylcarbamoyladenosine biosynthesis protein TsaE
VSAPELTTTSAEETEAVAERLGRALGGGELIGLVGDLGAGKTCFVRGLARGLGADPEQVHSPSFTMVTEYRGGRVPLTHVDLYRLDAPVDDSGFLREALYGNGVAAVEWFDRLRDAGQADALVVTFGFAGGDRRTLRLAPRGHVHERLLDVVTQRC